MMPAMSRVRRTMIDDRHMGTTWLMTMRQVEAPWIWAARIYSELRTVSASARARRA